MIARVMVATLSSAPTANSRTHPIPSRSHGSHSKTSIAATTNIVNIGSESTVPV